MIAFFNYKLLSIDLSTHKKFKEGFENVSYERIMPKMSLIKCRNNNSRRNSYLCRLF